MALSLSTARSNFEPQSAIMFGKAYDWFRCDRLRAGLEGCREINLNLIKLRTAGLGGVPREQEMLKGHLSRVMYLRV